MPFWRGLLGAIGGAIRRGFERGVRFLTELVRFGRPAPTAEIEEEVRAVREVVQTMAPHEALEAIAEWGTLEAHYEAARIIGEKPLGVIVDPERLPVGPFRWLGGKAGATIEVTYFNPILGETVTRGITFVFDRPADLGALAMEAISRVKGYEPGMAMAPIIEWRLIGVSRRKE